MTSTTNSNIAPSSPAVPPKEKLGTIMAAASALTSLGDEDSQATDLNARGGAGGSADETSDLKKDEKSVDPAPKVGKTSQQKRYLPQHKKPDAALTFPEKVSTLVPASPW